MMLPDTQDLTANFLHYNHAYKILICRPCQHAIQKSAVDGHLLKHKIYRNKRQSLLIEIAKLDLPEPEDIVQPSHVEVPIEGLPIHRGFRCAYEGCNYLTISEKRAKCHWSESHYPGLPLPGISEIAKDVVLQTFFKGTKLSYFEVESYLNEKWSSRTRTHDGVSSRLHKSHRTNVELSTTGTPLQMRTMSKLIAPRVDANPTAQSLDLETLSCLHHFMTVTAGTLPQGSHYWQQKAFRWARDNAALMSGLLALSARQQALTTDDMDASQRHRRLCERLKGDFQQLTDARSIHGENSKLTHESMMKKLLVVQIAALLRCACRVADRQIGDLGSWQHSSLVEVLKDVRLCWSHRSNRIDEIPSVVHVSVGNQLAGQKTEVVGEIRSQMPYAHLHDLPSRMAEIFGRPSSTEDVFAILSAISILHDCCELSFSSDTAATGWEGMCSWLAKVPSRFDEMLEACDVAALTVLAHWAGILVRRVELVGCWLLQGMSESLISQCLGHLSEKVPYAECLIIEVL